jgi:HSP20 family protein
MDPARSKKKERRKRRAIAGGSVASAFERTFQVPGDVDTDKIKASFKKGMLAVTLPKSAEARRAEMRITVTTG